MWTIYLHIMGGGVKYLDSLKSENNAYFIICRVIVPNTFFIPCGRGSSSSYVKSAALLNTLLVTLKFDCLPQCFRAFTEIQGLFN